jgi:3-deoxy-D-manno-octulosonic-acid transferase
MRRAVVDAISYVAAQHSEAAGRYVRLGVPSERIRVTGNTKYDQPVSEVTSEERRRLRLKLFGDDRPMLVLGSVRPGEELQWLEAIRAVQARSLLGVVLAPRHEEKFDYFADVLSREGFSFKRWSDMRDDKVSGVSTVLLDTMGELAEMYAIADLAFVGGSLVDHGGHNPLEPAAYGTPVCMGPFCRNAHEVVQLLREANAIIDLPEGEAAVSIIRELLEVVVSTGPARDELVRKGQRARAVWDGLQGSVTRTIAALEDTGVLTP